MYLLIDRPRRLVFTWRSSKTAERDIVVTKLTSRQGQRYQVVLNPTTAAAERQLESHRRGWATILSLLQEIEASRSGSAWNAWRVLPSAQAARRPRPANRAIHLPDGAEVICEAAMLAIM